MVPSSCDSTGIPFICNTRGEPSRKTVPSTVNSAAESEAALSGSAETSSVLGKPCSRRRVSSSTASRRPAATCGAFTTFTFSSSTAFSRPVSTALRRGCGPTSATCPSHRIRIRAGFVQPFAGNSVGPERSRFHLRQSLRIDQILRGWAERGVQRDEIAFGEQPLEWNQLDLHFARGGFADVRVIAKNAHVECFSAHGDLASDTSQTDEAQRLAANFGPRGAGFLPAALLNGLIQARTLVGQREEQREGVLRDANGVSAGRAHDQDAAARGFLEVDIVDADSGAANHAQVPGFFQ